MADTIGSSVDAFGRSVNLNLNVADFVRELTQKLDDKPLTVKAPALEEKVDEIIKLLSKINDPLMDSFDEAKEAVEKCVDHLKKSKSRDKAVRDAKERKKPKVSDAASGMIGAVKDIRKKLAERLVQEPTEAINKTLGSAAKSAKSSLKFSILNEMGGVVKDVAKGFANAMDVNVLKIFNGIFSGISASVDQRMMLYATQGRGGKAMQDTVFGTGKQGAQAASEAGVSFELMQQQINKEFQKGLNLQIVNGKLQRVSYEQQRKFLKSAIASGTVLGWSADETAGMFNDIQRNIGITSKDMYMFGRSLEHIALTSGVTGKSLMEAAHSAQELGKHIQEFSGLSARALGGLTEGMAIAKKYGAEKGMTNIIAALSQGMQSLVETAPDLAVTLKKVADDMKIPFMELDKVLQDPDMFKQFAGSLQDNIGKQLRQISGGKLSGNLALITKELNDLSATGADGAKQAAVLRLQLGTLFKSFGGAGGLEKFGKAATELRKTDEERIAELDKRIAATNNPAIRKALEDQKSALKESRAAQTVDEFLSKLNESGGNRQLALAAMNKGKANPINEQQLSEMAADRVRKLYSRAEAMGLDPKTKLGGDVNQVTKDLLSGNQDMQQIMHDLEDAVKIRERASQDPTADVNQKLLEVSNDLKGIITDFYNAYMKNWIAWGIAFGTAITSILTALAPLAFLKLLSGLKNLLGGAGAAAGAAGAAGGGGAAAAGGAGIAGAAGQVGKLTKLAKGVAIAGGVITTVTNLAEGKDVTTSVTKGVGTTAGGLIGGIFAGPLGAAVGAYVADELVSAFEHDVAANSASVAQAQDKNFAISKKDIVGDATTLQYQDIAKKQSIDAALLQAQKDLEKATSEYSKQQQYFEDWRVGVGGGGGMTAFFARFRSDQAVIDETAASQKKMMEAQQRVALLQDQLEKASQTQKVEPTVKGANEAVKVANAETIEKQVTLNDTNKILLDILSGIRNNNSIQEAGIDEDFENALIDFAEQGTEPGSIYTHDIHLEKLLASMIAGKGKSNLLNLGLFDKDNVGEAMDGGMPSTHHTNAYTVPLDGDNNIDKRSNPPVLSDLVYRGLSGFGRSAAGLQNLGLFDPANIKEVDDNAAPTELNYQTALGKGMGAGTVQRLIDRFTTTLDKTKETIASTGDGLMYDYSSITNGIMGAYGDNKGGISTSLLNTNEDIADIIEKDRVSNETDNSKVIAELRRLSENMEQSEQLGKILDVLTDILKKKDNVTIDLQTGAGGSKVTKPNSSGKVVKQTMKNVGWNGLQEPVYSPAANNSGIGVTGGYRA